MKKAEKVGVFSLTVLFAMMLGIGGIIFGQPSALAEQTYLIKMNVAGPPSPPATDTISYGCARLAKKLEENSGGRIKVKIFWGGSLYKDDATQLAALKGNEIQMCEVSGGRLGLEVPAAFLPALPFTFSNMDEVHRFLYGKPFKIFAASYAQHGYKLGAFWQHGFQDFICSKRFLVKPADFKGIKMRIRQSKLAASTMEALGASAQAIPYLETYTALQLGTVDGASIPLAAAQNVKWDEVVKYITLSRHSLLFTSIVINPDFYKSLPADLQKVMDDTQRENAEFLFNYQQDYEHKMPWVMMSDNPSLQFKWLTEKERAVLKKKTRPVWDQYAKRIPSELLDALKEIRNNESK